MVVRFRDIRVALYALMIALLVGCLQARRDADSHDMLPADCRTTAKPILITLTNGIQVILVPTPPVLGSGEIMLHAIYRKGILAEPKGMGGIGQRIQEILINLQSAKNADDSNGCILHSDTSDTVAVTLPQCTAYMTILNRDYLSCVLDAESRRLRGTGIVEIKNKGISLPDVMPPDVPFDQGWLSDFASFHQAWRYEGELAKLSKQQIKVVGSNLEQYYRAIYQPSNLMLLLVGDFEVNSCLGKIHQHLEDIHDTPLPSSEELLIDWGKNRTIYWEKPWPAIFMSFPIPEDMTEQWVLTCFGDHLKERFLEHPELAKMNSGLMTTGRMYPVGPLPFFIYARIEPAQDIEQVKNTLLAALYDTVVDVSEAENKMDLFASAWSIFDRQDIHNSEQLMNAAWALGQELTMCRANGHDPRALRVPSSGVGRVLRRYMDRNKAHFALALPTPPVP